MSDPGEAVELRRWAAVAAALAVVMYLPSLSHGFAYDDLAVIVRDRSLHSLTAIGEVFLRPYWGGEEGRALGLWRPITSASLALLWWIGDGSPLPFHLANLLAHAAVSALVVVVGGRMAGRWIGAGAGIVFAVHPVHVEAVANGVGLAELLAALFVLLALERWQRSGGRAGRDVALLYLLAFLSKESAVVLPGLVFVVEGASGRLAPGRIRERLRETAGGWIGMAGVVAGVLIARFVLLGSPGSALPPLGADLLLEIPRIHTVGEIWAHHLRLLFFPARLSPDYTPAVISVTTVWTAVGMVGVGGVLALLAAALLLARRAGREPAARGAVVGVLWMVVALSPVTNLVVLTGVLVAERTLYLPSVGAALAMASVAGALAGVRAGARGGAGVERIGGPAAPPGRSRVVALATLPLVLLLAVRSWTAIPHWRSHEAVFDRMLEVVPESGRSVWVRGERAFADGRTDEALREWRVAIQRTDGHPEFLLSVGRALIGSDRPGTAAPFLERAWRDDPGDPVAPRLRAVLAGRLGDAEAQALWIRRTLAADPEDPVARHLRERADSARGGGDSAPDDVVTEG